MVAIRIGKSIRYVVATAEYLKGRKLPVEPTDLETARLCDAQRQEQRDGLGPGLR